MNREQFEHVVRAVVDVVDDDVVVIGSQAILAQHADVPTELLRSAELAVFPRTKLEVADDIDGAMGDGSLFHQTYGYYAHMVGPDAVVAPAGWQGRLIKVELENQRKRRRVVAWCLDKHDLVLAKLAAGREHDLEFVTGAIAAGLVDTEPLELGIDLLPADQRGVVRQRLTACVRGAG